MIFPHHEILSKWDQDRYKILVLIIHQNHQVAVVTEVDDDIL